MSQRKVKDAKDLENDELIYFKGHAKATYMSDGTNVEDALTKKQDEIKDLANAIGNIDTILDNINGEIL
jgi:hypothetical protein